MNENDKSRKWDSLYSKGRQGKYPYEMLVRFINSKFLRERRSGCKVLDLGFGTGRHLIYLLEEGFQVFGIEASSIGADVAKAWLTERGLKAQLKVGSALEQPLWDDEFDAVIDISSIQHNIFSDMKQIVSNVFQSLKPKGYFFSVLKTRNDSLRKQGRKLEGITRYFPDGVEKVGNSTIISFSSFDDVIELYSAFSDVHVEKEEWTYNDMTGKVSHWVVTAQK